MSKSVKLDDQVYQDLDQLREKRETFSQAVQRLLKLWGQIEGLGLPGRGQHLDAPR